MQRALFLPPAPLSTIRVSISSVGIAPIYNLPEANDMDDFIAMEKRFNSRIIVKTPMRRLLSEAGNLNLPIPKAARASKTRCELAAYVLFSTVGGVFNKKDPYIDAGRLWSRPRSKYRRCYCRNCPAGDY